MQISYDPYSVPHTAIAPGADAKKRIAHNSKKVLHTDGSDVPSQAQDKGHCKSARLAYLLQPKEQHHTKQTIHRTQKSSAKHDMLQQNTEQPIAMHTHNATVLRTASCKSYRIRSTASCHGHWMHAACKHPPGSTATVTCAVHMYNRIAAGVGRYTQKGPCMLPASTSPTAQPQGRVCSPHVLLQCARGQAAHVVLP
jgi:hypothetical protein